MTAPHIRYHLGSRVLDMLPRRDWPEGVVQAAGEDNEAWLYEDHKPVRRLSDAEAWEMLRPKEAPR